MKQNHINSEDHITRIKAEEQLTELLGIFQGIAIDNDLNQQKINFLETWLDSNTSILQKRPFNGFVEYIHSILEQGHISEEIQNKIVWLGQSIRTKYFDEIVHGIGQLQGILKGVAADTLIDKEELQGLQTWLDEHRHLETSWPFDEVEVIVAHVLEDGIVDEEEHESLIELFTDFIK